MVQLSTGDMLRAAVAAGTAVGQRAKAVMDAGELVSDDIVNGILSDRLDADDARAGFTLDGYPRTQAQAESLDAMLGAKGLRLDHVIELEVEEGGARRPHHRALHLRGVRRGLSRPLQAAARRRHPRRLRHP